MIKTEELMFGDIGELEQFIENCYLMGINPLPALREKTGLEWIYSCSEGFIPSDWEKTIVVFYKPEPEWEIWLDGTGYQVVKTTYIKWTNDLNEEKILSLFTDKRFEEIEEE